MIEKFKLNTDRTIAIISVIFGAIALIFAGLVQSTTRNGSDVYWQTEIRSLIPPPIEGIVAENIATQAGDSGVRVITVDIWNAGTRDILPEDNVEAFASVAGSKFLQFKWLESNFGSTEVPTKCSAEGCSIELTTLRQGYAHRFVAILDGWNANGLSLTSEIPSGSITQLPNRTIWSLVMIFFAGSVLLFGIVASTYFHFEYSDPLADQKIRTIVLTAISAASALLVSGFLIFVGFQIIAEIVSPSVPF